MLGHSQTKERDNREPKLRPKPARQSSTLLMSGDWKRNYGANCDTGIGESSRKQYSLAAYGHRASRRLYVRPEGAYHLWREVPPGELSIDPVADERLGWATGRVEAS